MRCGCLPSVLLVGLPLLWVRLIKVGALNAWLVGLDIVDLRFMVTLNYGLMCLALNVRCRNVIVRRGLILCARLIRR